MFDFASLKSLQQLNGSQNPRKSRCFILLLAFKLFFSEDEAEIQQLLKEFKLPNFKDLIFLNSFEASLESDLSPSQQSKYELSFRKLYLSRFTLQCKFGEENHKSY